MKDPAFLFYPGDYLRDTQTLSEKSQVAYDRIMCEHMRNICISKNQLKFFTKKLNEDEIEELMFVLSEKKDGFYISWVAESIEKRRAYSESRRKNRSGRNKKDMKNTSKTYDKHMENEIENVNESKDEVEVKKRASEKNLKTDPELKIPWATKNFLTQWQHWKIYKKKEFGFKYKSLQSEQAALTELANLSEDNEKKAIAIMHQSMSNGWRGFFELKNQNNGNSNAKREPTINRQTREVIESNMRGW